MIYQCENPREYKRVTYYKIVYDDVPCARVDVARWTCQIAKYACRINKTFSYGNYYLQ